jgi:osmotically-inducible protein OsmY
MIKSVISSAARLSLAPARLAGRMAGSAVRELRGNGGTDAHPARSSTRAKPASRSRAGARPKRAATGTRAKARPKRAATGTRAKARPKRAATGTRAKAQPRRAATGTRAKAQPRRAPRHKPLDDAAIARKVESTIFRGVDVDRGEIDVKVGEGVVSLRGEVPTQDLINELQARATQLTEVRRVENLLQLPKTPAPGRTDIPSSQPEAGPSAARPEDHETVLGETAEEEPAPVPAARTGNSAAFGRERGAAPVGTASSAAGSAPDAPEGDASVEQDEAEEAEPALAERDKDRTYQPSDPSLHDLEGG